MEAGLNGLETTFAMILITIKNAFMTMETAADYQHKRTFAFNAPVKVSWNIDTVYNLILCIVRNFLETRVFINILIHPCFPRNFH